MKRDDNLFIYMLLALTLLCVIFQHLGSISKPVKHTGGTRSRKDKAKRIGLWGYSYTESIWKNFSTGQTEIAFDCEVECIVSNDKRDPLRYDAIYFHGRVPQDIPKQRTDDQVYIFFWRESPANKHRKFILEKSFYNWTVTYSPQSDVRVPYIITEEKHGDANKSLNLPQLSYKRKPTEAMIAWVVSHCYTFGRREMYVKVLNDYTKVDIFGDCGRPCPRGHCQRNLAATGRYKFYLSFENAACRDYITEKPRVPLQFGIVPIVYGGLTGEEHAKYLPPNSYIDVRDYKSPEHLAKYLLYLDGNDTAYMQYFDWKSKYDIRNPSGKEYVCQICQALHNNTRKNVDMKQFYNVTSECDSEFVDKVMGKKRNYNTLIGI